MSEQLQIDMLKAQEKIDMHSNNNHKTEVPNTNIRKSKLQGKYY